MAATVYHYILASTPDPAQLAGMTAGLVPMFDMYDAATLNGTPSRRIPVPSQMATYAAAHAGSMVAWDAENYETLGQYMDERTSNRRRCRFTARQLARGIAAGRTAAPTTRQTIYGLQTRDLSAIYAGGAALADWQSAMTYEASIAAPACDCASGDLYLFSWMDALSTAQVNTIVDRWADQLQVCAGYCAGPFAAGRALALIDANYHPADPLAAQPVNASLWARITNRLAAKSFIDPLYWGVYQTVTPYVPGTWADWIAVAANKTNWDQYRAAWGLPIVP